MSQVLSADVLSVENSRSWRTNGLCGWERTRERVSMTGMRSNPSVEECGNKWRDPALVKFVRLNSDLPPLAGATLTVTT